MAVSTCLAQCRAYACTTLRTARENPENQAAIATTAYLVAATSIMTSTCTFLEHQTQSREERARYSKLEVSMEEPSES
jgi:hypothetical protein